MPKSAPLKIGKALGPDQCAFIELTIAIFQIPDRWCSAQECACMGCANQHLSWAEYECWRKYGSHNKQMRGNHE